METNPHKSTPILTALHRAYKILLSPLFGTSCRFDPPCSDYCYNAIRTHGYLRGIWLGLRRVVRCQPLCEGGCDPVPPPGPKERMRQ